MKTSWLIFCIASCGFVYYKYQQSRKNLEARYPAIFQRPISELEDFEIRFLHNSQKEKKNYALTALALLAFSLWGGAWQPYQAKLEVERQRVAFVEGFDQGWEYYCKEAFDYASGSISLNGYLYAGSNIYDISWCRGLQSASAVEKAYVEEARAAWAEFSDVESSASSGRSAGYSRAREAIFSGTPYLCYGTDCITKDSEENRAIDSYMQDSRNDDMYDWGEYDGQ